MIVGHSSLYSYLKSLVPSFNECADKFLEGLRPLADGKTTVPMKEHLAEVTQDVISKVGCTCAAVKFSLNIDQSTKEFTVVDLNSSTLPVN